jgi:Skp family chaperone for outer membrane proteins
MSDQQWQQEFNHNVEQDKQAQKNYEDEFDYQKIINDRDYNYKAKQDEIAMDKYLEGLQADETKEQAEQSERRIDKYSETIDKMLSSTTEDEFGNKTQKYSLDDAWDYLIESGLSDDEIAAIINNNYELSKYAESKTGKSVTDSGRPYSYGSRNY